MAGPAQLIEYFEVRYQVYGTVDDGPDADDLPDNVDITGWITFTANLRKGRGILFQGGTPPFELVPLRRRVRVVAGKLSHNDTGYVKLEAASVNGNPSNWNWKVSFDLASPTGKLDLAPFDIAAEPGSIVDLTTAAPVGGSSGTTIVRGATGTSVGEVVLVSGDRFEFYGDDPDRTLIGDVIVPALTVRNDTLQAAAIATAAAEQANSDQILTAGHRAAAEGAAGTAITARNAAEGARDTAVSARDIAVTQASDASTDRAAAQAARTGAEGARDTANSARETATGAATTATNAATTATGARDAAVAARNQAEGFADEAEQAVLGVVPDNSIATGKLQDDAVTTAKVAPGIRTSLGKADSAYQKPGAGIAKADLVASVRTTLDKADAALPATAAPADFVWISHTGTRKVGTGDIGPQRIGRTLRVDQLVYQFDTADASGSTTVELLNNGTPVPGSQLTVTAANQADGTATDAARTVTLTDAARDFGPGSRFALRATAVGTTPGKGLRAWVKATWIGL